jgi:hypothetical protein
LTALLGAFFFGVALFPAFALTSITLARRAPAVAFLVAFVSGAVSVCSVVDFIFSPCAVITAIT